MLISDCQNPGSDMLWISQPIGMGLMDGLYHLGFQFQMVACLGLSVDTYGSPSTRDNLLGMDLPICTKDMRVGIEVRLLADFLRSRFLGCPLLPCGLLRSRRF